MRFFWARFLLILPAVGVTACLRLLDTPDPWPCSVDGDCQSGQVCYRPTGNGGGTCRSPDYCEYDADCAGTTACIANACVPVQCTDEDQAMCAPYVCNGRACLTSCTPASGCDSEHVCQERTCVPIREE